MSSMMKIVGTALCASLLLVAPACKKKNDANKASKKTAGKTTEAKVEPKTEPKVEPPKAMTPDELSKWYADCWSQMNAKAWDKFGACYADTATSEDVDSGYPTLTGKDIIEKGIKTWAAAFPDMMGANAVTLVNGKNIAGAWLMTGTNSGPMTGPDGSPMPATNKKMGMMAGHLVTVGDDNKVASEKMFWDAGTMMGQLGLHKMPTRAVMDKLPGEPMVIIATDSETEKANVEAVNKMFDAFNKHDLKAIGEGWADDAAIHDQTAPKDQTKKELMGFLGDLVKGFSDIKIEGENVWAAGDYVVFVEHRTGTNDGDMKPFKLKKTGKKIDYRAMIICKMDGGKVKEAWEFANGMAPMMQLGMIPMPGAAGAAPADKGAAPADKGAKVKITKPNKAEKPAK